MTNMNPYPCNRISRRGFLRLFPRECGGCLFLFFASADFAADGGGVHELFDRAGARNRLDPRGGLDVEPGDEPGADFGRPGRLRFIQRTRQLIPVTVPLFVAAFRRAEDLILAMEARCYVGGAGRSAVHLGRLAGRDWSGLAAAVFLTGALWRVPFPL